MKVTAISDTHGQHDKLQLPGGNVLIHAGDITNTGNPKEVENFINWFALQKYEHKIFIAGNHDFYFEKNKKFKEQKNLPKDVIYLEDSGVEINGIYFWGSPITPTFFDWAFNKNRGKEIATFWEKIPENTDVLITHGPAFGILDQTSNFISAGCEELVKKIQTIKPKFHVFGHIHEDFGVLKIKQTTFINASVLDHRYRFRNDSVIEFEI